MDLLAPTEGQDIVADYDHTSLTLRRHPLALLRDRFNAKGYLTAADVGRDQQPAARANHRHRNPVASAWVPRAASPS